MINLKATQDELLAQHYNTIINRINYFQKEGKRFVLKDLLEEERYNTYYINKTKGILETLIAFGYIEIISLYNNYRNYVFICKREIP